MYSYSYEEVLSVCEKYGYLTQATQEQLEKMFLFMLPGNKKLRDISIMVWLLSSSNIGYEDVLHRLMSHFHPVKDKQ